jgi:hypothetical protein
VECFDYGPRCLLHGISTVTSTSKSKVHDWFKVSHPRKNICSVILLRYWSFSFTATATLRMLIVFPSTYAVVCIACANQTIMSGNAENPNIFSVRKYAGSRLKIDDRIHFFRWSHTQTTFGTEWLDYEALTTILLKNVTFYSITILREVLNILPGDLNVLGGILYVGWCKGHRLLLSSQDH